MRCAPVIVCLAAGALGGIAARGLFDRPPVQRAPQVEPDAPTLRPAAQPNAPDHEQQQTRIPTRPTATGMARNREWWIYSRDPERPGICPEQYRLHSHGLGDPGVDSPRREGPEHLWLVTEHSEGHRAVLLLGPVPRWSGASEASRTVSVQFDVRDAETDRAVLPLLVDVEGTPYGPVGMQPVRLVPGFRGLVLASGYVPAHVEAVTPADPAPATGAREETGVSSVVHARLVRAGYLTGRIVGAFSAGDIIRCRAAADEDWTPVAADGRFLLGPLPTGESTLFFTGRAAEIAGRRLLVREGHQDLGDLPLDALGELHLVLVSTCPSPPRSAYVSAYFWRNRAWAQSHPMKLTVHEVPVDEHGRATLEKVRSDVLAGTVWTSSGEIGELPPTHRPPLGQTSATRIELRAPGSLVVASRTGGLPPRCSVAAVDRAYGRRADSLELREFRRPHLRARQTSVSEDGVARLLDLWPVEYDVVLLSPDGFVIDRTSARVFPGHEGRVHFTSPSSAGGIRLRNVRATAEVRFAVLDDDGGVSVRGVLQSGEERALELLPAGVYRLLEWSFDGERPNAPSIPLRREVRVRPSGEESVELGR